MHDYFRENNEYVFNRVIEALVGAAHGAHDWNDPPCVQHCKIKKMSAS